MGLKAKTRSDARALNLAHYWPDSPCKHGHIAARSVANYSCQECQRLQKSKYYYENKESFLHRCKRTYQADKAKILKRSAAYYERNRVLCKEKVAQWQRNNPDKVVLIKQKYREQNREKLRDANKRRYRSDRGRSFANSAAARVRKIRAFPVWADRSEIKKIYAEARRLTDATGVKHSVDHYYPLAGENVCGLHVHTNLQILTLEANVRKSNRHPE